jgi:AraC family transcriptional regulator of adaptative response/methylated-DNA-[protein]-cysteine methyltransferase
MTATQKAIDETIYRQALAQRDAAFDGVFYYGVLTTGVYCRPSCAARAPREENVRFFVNSENAERAGFRPCKRCRPNETRPQDELVKRACEIIETAESAVSLNELGAQLGVSAAHLQRAFKRVLGLSPRAYAAARRVAECKTEMRNGRSVTDALYEAGYGSSSRLYEKAKDNFGMTPAAYRRGGLGMTITYTVAPCALGQVLVAATKRGVCAVTLGDAAETLTENLRGEFPRAAISEATDGLGHWLDAVLRHLEDKQQSLELPLDVQATAFQARVWAELRRIPYGATATYSEIAARLGQPAATRAVARACATNPAALVTPCHRVIGANGALSGYRWGLERKRALLDKEKAAEICE